LEPAGILPVVSIYLSGVNVNTIFLRKNAFWVPTLAALAVVGTSLAAQAQTVQPSNQASPEATVSNLVQEPQFSPQTPAETANRTNTPVPGTVATLSTGLTSQDAATSAQPNQLAQSDISPGTATRGGRSYVGVAGNIGLTGGSSSLADGNFTIISKIGFTRTFSLRPAAVLGDSTTILVPVTYDFSFQQLGDAFSEPLPIAPYVGVGAAIRTGNKSDTALMVTGGIDLPLSRQFTATAAVNAGFFNKTDVGLLLGVGYNFSGF
jgi:hypothetical protein